MLGEMRARCARLGVGEGGAGDAPGEDREVLAARSEAGVDPETADRVLQRLDVRSLATSR